MTHIGVLLVVGLALRVVGAIPVVFAVLPVPSYISKDASCLSYSQTGCAEAAAASYGYALDCVIDDPTGYGFTVLTIGIATAESSISPGRSPKLLL